MRDIWFEYVIKNKDLWPQGFTLKRLEKVKDQVLNDKNIMFDLLKRHGADEKTPEAMKASDSKHYDHCIGNFCCNILYKMRELGIVK